MSRIALLIALALLGATGCGGSPQPRPPATADTDGDGVPDREDAAPHDATAGGEKRVAVTLSLERRPTGPPDAGTQGGHRGGEAVAETGRSSLRFTGTAAPATAEVTAAPEPGVRARVTPVGDHGDFTVTVSSLERGQNRLVLRARAEGHTTWSQRVIVTRR